MKWRIFACACAAAFLFFLQGAWAAEETYANLRWLVTVNKDVSTEDFAEAGHGKGKRTNEKYTFTVRIEPTGKEILNAQVYLFPVVGEANWKEDSQLDKLVGSIHKSEVVTLLPDKPKTFELGPQPVSYYRAVNGNTIWTGGYKYSGYAAELRINGKIVSTRMVGDRSVKGAIQKFKDSDKYPKEEIIVPPQPAPSSDSSSVPPPSSGATNSDEKK